MRIALDAMGGDHAPEQIVQGAVEALPLLAPGDVLTLVGPAERLRSLLQSHHPATAGLDQIAIEHAPDVIGMHESPVEAVRHKRNSSLVRMFKLASGDAADVLISAGNTGALVAAGVLLLKALPGVDRPGIAVTIPTPHGPVMLCDAGANVQPKPAHLHQYAVMTRLYMQYIHAVANPRIGLLNVGTEEEKGTPLVKEAHGLLRADPTLNYVGYTEGRSIFSGACDVLVTDGFTGNVVLKIIEGLTGSLLRGLTEQFGRISPELLAAARKPLQCAADQYDHEEYGGALLLGLSGLVLKVHGAGGARAIKNAVKTARAASQMNINEAISRHMHAAGS